VDRRRTTAGAASAGTAGTPELPTASSAVSDPGTPGAPADAERLKREEYLVVLGGPWANGWLAFETKGEKRRLLRFPDDWSAMSDEGLRELCRLASLVKPSSRRVD
jgi:hypothetical protein